LTDERVTLVTGAAGLIGSAVLAKLRAQGRRALGVDLAPKPEQPDVERADLTDIHRLHAIARNAGVGAIVHCGAVSGPMVMIENPHGIIQTNVVGTVNILELARIHRMRRVVFCSSASAYGPASGPLTPDGALDENTPLRPSSVYGATKVACEALIQGYRVQHKMDAVSIRLSWVYGPGRTTDCVVRTMIQNTLNGKATHLPFGREFPRQFIYVEDASDALIAALDAPVCPGAVYNATGGVSVTLGELAGLVRAALGGGDIVVEAGPDPLDDLQHRLDISAIARDLGFHPKVALPEGISRYAAWLGDR
jgi:UDP-glucuronate 4-epimerase